MGMETANGTYDSENRSVEEMTRYLNGLKRYTEKEPDLYGWKTFRAERMGEAV